MTIVMFQFQTHLEEYGHSLRIYLDHLNFYNFNYDSTKLLVAFYQFLFSS